MFSKLGHRTGVHRAHLAGRALRLKERGTRGRLNILMSGLCDRVRGTGSSITTLGAAVRVDHRLMHVHGGSFRRKVTASASIVSTRAVLSGIRVTFLLTCCGCSITLTSLLSAYKVPRDF